MWIYLLLFAGAACAAEPARFALQTPQDDFASTILDGSRWVEAPTGKHGFLQVRGDKFVFEDGTPARFWGAQIGLFEKARVDYLVRRMRKQGINIVRLHHLPWLVRKGAASMFDYDPEAFDRLDYTIAKLGEQGIYIILDTDYPLHTRIGPAEKVPGLESGGPAPFAEFFNAEVARLKRKRLLDVLTRVNAYTKKRYLDDPTLALVEIHNEDSLFWYGADRLAEPFKTQLEDAFKDWLKRKYGGESGLRSAWTVQGKAPLSDGEGLGDGQRMAILHMSVYDPKTLDRRPEIQKRAQDQLRFFLELEEQYFLGSREMLRKAGLKVPVSGTNWQGGGFTTRVHLLGQSRLDYIDRHGYWDHPQGEGNLKWRIATAKFVNLPMVKALLAAPDPQQENNVGNLVVAKSWERVFGKPLTISEWNTCLPNEYSLEGTGLMAVYGSMQGWSGSLQFAYSSPDWPGRLSAGSFDLLGNPPQILQFFAAAAMWHRGDVKEAPVVGETVYTPESVFEFERDRRPLPQAAALVGKVGYRFVDRASTPVKTDVSRFWDPERLVARSLTGELVWDARNGVVTVDTPRTQAVIGFLSAGVHRLSAVEIESPARFGALYVTAMDGMKPVREASRLVITAVGPARNTGMEYERTDEIASRYQAPFWRLKQVGEGPVLLDAITGRLRIQTAQASSLRVWTLDVNGRRRAPVSAATRQGAIEVRLDASHEAVYYELAPN